MGKEPTTKQKAFLENLTAGMTRTEAAIKAGYKAPRASAAQNIRTYTQAFRKAFEKKGMTINKIADGLIKGTFAMRESFDERTGEWKEIADWSARHRYFDTIIKVQGYYPSEKHEVSGKDGGPVEVIFK